MQHAQELRKAAQDLQNLGWTPTAIGARLGLPRSTVWGWLKKDEPEVIAIDESPRRLRVLLYDIETAPLLAYIWSPCDEYVQMDRLIHDSFLLSWSAKWLGEDAVEGDVVSSEEAVRQDDQRIVARLAELIRSADLVVAHNGDSFDLPKLNNRLLQLGIQPLGPVKTIDTLSLARKNFRLAYNKLDYLGEFLGLGRKIHTEFELWRSCYMGDGVALGKMLKYNKQDVVLLEKVFNALKPYVRSLPRLVDAGYDGQIACPFCGSEKLKESGLYRTNASTFQKYVCGDCGRHGRSKTAIRESRLGVSVI